MRYVTLTAWLVMMSALAWLFWLLLQQIGMTPIQAQRPALTGWVVFGIWLPLARSYLLGKAP